MSQLDVSIFYSHLFTLLLTLYIFSHFMVGVIITNYYNNKLRDLDSESSSINYESINKIQTLIRILD